MHLVSQNLNNKTFFLIFFMIVVKDQTLKEIGKIIASIEICFLETQTKLQKKHQRPQA